MFYKLLLLFDKWNMGISQILVVDKVKKYVICRTTLITINIFKAYTYIILSFVSVKLHPRDWKRKMKAYKFTIYRSICRRFFTIKILSRPIADKLPYLLLVANKCIPIALQQAKNVRFSKDFGFPLAKLLMS